MTLTEMAVHTAREDFIEHGGVLSLVGASALEIAGLSPEYFERKFESERATGCLSRLVASLNPLTIEEAL